MLPIYKLPIGKNRLICRGRGIVGPDYYRAGITFVLVSIPCILVLASPCAYFLQERDEPAPLILTLVFAGLTLTFLILTATTNPGVIPKQKQGFAEGPLNAPIIGSQGLMYEGRSREMTISGSLLKLKYCETCTLYLGSLYRPPRASHCSECDCCVEKFDHHCPWVGNCIAKRNYRYFLSFLTCTSLLIWLLQAICIAHLVAMTEDENTRDINNAFAQAAKKGIPSWIVLAYSFLGMWFVEGLWCFHIYLCSSGQTTNEKLKGTWKALDYNPFSRGNAVFNLLQVCCFAIPPKRFKLHVSASPDSEKITISPSKLALSSYVIPKSSQHRPPHPKREKALQKSIYDGTVSPGEIELIGVDGSLSPMTGSESRREAG